MLHELNELAMQSSPQSIEGRHMYKQLQSN